MADFDYSNDIAPLKGNYFRDKYAGSSMTQDERRSLELMELKELERGVRDRAAHENTMLDFKRQKLAFQEAELRLKTTRKQIQDQLDLEEALPKIEPMLKSLIDDPNIDTPTKILEAEKMRLGYAKFGSPLINNIFDNVTKSLGTKDVNEALRKQAAYRAAELGDKSAAQTIAGTGTEAAQTLGVLADTVRQKQQQELESEKQKSLFESQEEKEKGKTDVLKNQLEYIQKLSPAKDELKTGERGWGEGTTGTTDVTKPFLKPVDKIALIKMYKKYNPIAADLGMDDLPDDFTLVTDVYGKLYDEYTARTGTKPASKISEKSK